jgi:hypothetical protein
MNFAKMAKETSNKKYKAREDVVFTDLDDGSAVLLHLQTKYYFSLNETGSFLWKLIEREAGATQEEMIEELCAEFDVSAERAHNDVSDFIADLKTQGLVK